jgi:uncharacterized protein (DUF58 family)
VVVVLAIAVGFAAINTGNNLLYLLLGWVLSFIIASGILSENTLKRLAVSRRPPPRVWASEPFLMEVVIENLKTKRASYSIEVEDLVSAGSGDGRLTPLDKRCYFLKIPEGKSQRTSYRHTFVRRGKHVLAGYRLATKFPFALFRKSRDVEEPLEIIVYPARVAVPRPPPRQHTRGDATTARMGRRGEFFGLRERRLGDDRRDVHWKSSARTGRLLVREYEDELARRVVIGVDNALTADVRDAITDAALTPAMDDQVSAVERAISIAASLATVYLEAGWTVELAARGAHVGPGLGKTHESKILRALAVLEYADPAEPFTNVPPRVEVVMVVPRNSRGSARPTSSQMVEA